MQWYQWSHKKDSCPTKNYICKKYFKKFTHSVHVNIKIFFSFAVLNRKITEFASPVLKKLLGIKHDYLDWFSSALDKIIGLRLTSSVSIVTRYLADSNKNLFVGSEAGCFCLHN